MAELPEALDTLLLNETLGILGPADGRCVPEGCPGDDLLQDIRTKFHLVFYPALRWAIERLADRGYSAHRLLELVLVIERSAPFAGSAPQGGRFLERASLRRAAALDHSNDDRRAAV